MRHYAALCGRCRCRCRWQVQSHQAPLAGAASGDMSSSGPAGLAGWLTGLAVLWLRAVAVMGCPLAVFSTATKYQVLITLALLFSDGELSGLSHLGEYAGHGLKLTVTAASDSLIGSC